MAFGTSHVWVYFVTLMSFATLDNKFYYLNYVNAEHSFCLLLTVKQKLQ